MRATWSERIRTGSGSGHCRRRKAPSGTRRPDLRNDSPVDRRRVPFGVFRRCCRMEPAVSNSPALQRFLDSTVVGYEKWHDSEGYDLAALSELTTAERRQVEDLVFERSIEWREIEVLEALDSPGHGKQSTRPLPKLAVSTPGWPPPRPCTARGHSTRRSTRSSPTGSSGSGPSRAPPRVLLMAEGQPTEAVAVPATRAGQ